MDSQICEMLGIDFPLVAFTHCRDVVAAVSQAGGFGVLGAVGFTPEQLEIECKWIDEHVGDHPYGVDLVIPQRYEGMGELDPEKLEAQLVSLIPDQHREFAAKLLADHGIPEIPPEEQTCAQDGVLGAIAGVMGSMQAVEVIKELLGLGESMAGQLLIHDALGATFRKVRVKPDPECPLCGGV